MAPKKQQMNLEMTACVESLKLLSRFMMQVQTSLEIPEKCCRALELAADEAVTNIIQHGCADDPDAGIRLSLSRQSEWVTLMLEDRGPAFEMPASIPAPDPCAPLEKREAGGLGLFIMESMVDRIERIRSDGVNLLLLKKKIC